MLPLIWWKLRHLNAQQCTSLVIALQADASDYGAGVYLSQTIDGKQDPVAFFSEFLYVTQPRLSVIKKEACALLRDY